SKRFSGAVPPADHRFREDRGQTGRGRAHGREQLPYRFHERPRAYPLRLGVLLQPANEVCKPRVEGCVLAGAWVLSLPYKSHYGNENSELRFEWRRVSFS